MKTFFKFSLKALWSNQEGSVFPMIGVLVVSLVGATGAAVDTGRAQLVQSRLSSSLDAAGLAAGATINTQSLQTEAQKYLEVNFNNYLGSELEDVSVTIDSDNTLITLTASARLPTTFMRVLGKDEIRVSALSEISRGSPGSTGQSSQNSALYTGLELVMVLDNTGSMYGSKLYDLKTAAIDLIDILYGNNESVEKLWIGLVPFSQGVNIGDHNTSWTEPGSFHWGNTDWAGCVDAREADGRDVTDDPPSVALFPKYYWPCDDRNKWYGTNGNRSNCRLRNNTRYKSTSSSRGPNKMCPQEVLPLTGNKSAIINAINGMDANGNTHINLGAAWGWRMLSPRWRGLWGGEMDANDLPLNYNTEKMKKAAIIMTDGDNVISNTAHGAYWYLSDGKLGTTYQGSAENQLDQRLLEVCTAMKDNNIIVYTITFGYLSGNTQNLMRNCASQEDFYFASASSDELRTAFHAIGDSLANLRVSR